MKNEKSAENAAKKKVMTDEQTEMLLDQLMEKPSETKAVKPKLLTIKLDKLHPFKDHPYKVQDNDSMNELEASIADVGLLNRIIVRPLENTADEYEIISGHRRVHAAEHLGMKEVPAVVHFIDHDEATLLMVDSNNQRETLLPSEKAFAYKMKMDALSHQGKTCGQVGHKSREEVSEKESGRTVQRYIRLTYLVPELLKFVDEKKIAMSPAVELSYLDEEAQRDVVDRIDDTDIFPSHAQTRRMRKLFEEGELDYDTVAEIMAELKPNQKESLKLPMDSIRTFFPRDYTPQQMTEKITKLLEENKRKERNRSEDRSL